MTNDNHSDNPDKPDKKEDDLFVDNTHEKHAIIDEEDKQEILSKPSRKEKIQVNNFTYDADTGRLFQIWFLNAIFRILTLGIYTFWGKTRLRRYVASGFSLGGDRFEYTGTGMELFKGFLKAIPLFLLAYGPFIAANIYAAETESFWHLLAFIPLGYFFPLAYFAARRYRLSRTTWRSIRFYLSGSAISYANFAIWRAFLNIITLGILIPSSQALLHKYVVDRMIFGDIEAKFHIEAINRKKLVWLYLASIGLVIFIPLVTVGTLGIIGAIADVDGDKLAGPMLLGFSIILPLWAIVHYKYQAELLRGKINGMVIGEIRFKALVTPGKIFKLQIGNALIAMFSFGWGRCFIIQRRMRFLKNNVLVGGDLNSQTVKQAIEQSAGIGEGIDDIFDFDTGFIGGGII